MRPSLTTEDFMPGPRRQKGRARSPLRADATTRNPEIRVCLQGWRRAGDCAPYLRRVWATRVERLGYCRSSLRDVMLGMLVAFGRGRRRAHLYWLRAKRWEEPSMRTVPPLAVSTAGGTVWPKSSRIYLPSVSLVGP